MSLFSKSSVRQIYTHLQIQQHRMFKEAIYQDKIIKEVMVKNGELKVIKKQNNNQGYGSKGNSSFI